MFVSDLPLDKGVVEAEVLEEMRDVGPAKGMDVQAGRITEFIDVVPETAVQVGLGNREPVGRGEDFKHGRGQPRQSAPVQVSRTSGDQSKTVSTERLLGGDPRCALPYLTCRTPNSPNWGARRFREESTVCRCVTSLARSPQA